MSEDERRLVDALLARATIVVNCPPLMVLEVWPKWTTQDTLFNVEWFMPGQSLGLFPLGVN